MARHQLPLAAAVATVSVLAVVSAGDINRQSIVFYPATPDVFYCPQEKPISLEGMIVKAKPLKNLCQFEGRPLPKDYKSDCWGDVDETEFACAEKRRIETRLRPPGHENAVDDNYLPIFRAGEYKIREIDPHRSLEEQQAEHRARARAEAEAKEKEERDEKSREPKLKF